MVGGSDHEAVGGEVGGDTGALQSHAGEAVTEEHQPERVTGDGSLACRRVGEHGVSVGGEQVPDDLRREVAEVVGLRRGALLGRVPDLDGDRLIDDGSDADSEGTRPSKISE